MDCSTPGFPVLHYLQSLLKFMSMESVMPSNHLILSPPSPPALNLFQHKVFSNELALHIRQPIIRTSASESVFPMNIQGWFPLGLTGFVSLLFKGLSRVFSSTTVWKHQLFGTQPSLWSNSHIHTWLLEKPKLGLYGPLLAKWCLCFFNTLSRFVISFLPRSKHLLISGLQSSSTVNLEPEKIVCNCFHCFPIYLPWSNGTRCHDLSFLNAEF